MAKKSASSGQASSDPGYLPGPKPSAPIPRYQPGSSPGRHRPNDEGDDIDSYSFSVAGIDGKIDRRKANIANRIVDTDPGQALRVIRNWLAQN